MKVVRSRSEKSEERKKRNKKDDSIDQQIMEAGDYEVTNDMTFDIDIHLTMEDKRWKLLDRQSDSSVKETVTMRMWSYDEMIDLKKKATTFDNSKRMHLVDQDFLNRLKIQKFMVRWTFDKANSRLMLHRVNGVMTDGSWDVFRKLQPNIINYIIRRMNDIYEYGE